MTSLLRSSIPLTGQTIYYRNLAKPLPPGLADGDCISSPDSVVELIDIQSMNTRILHKKLIDIQSMGESDYVQTAAVDNKQSVTSMSSKRNSSNNNISLADIRAEKHRRFLLEQQSKSSINGTSSSTNPQSDGFKSIDNQCKICLEHLELAGPRMPVRLKSCGHKYHLQCIRDAMKYQCSMKCPECRNLILTITSPHDQLKYLQGDSPAGQMHVQLDMSSCAGYEDCGSIIITYNMETNPNSMQASWKRQKRVAFYLIIKKEMNYLTGKSALVWFIL